MPRPDPSDFTVLCQRITGFLRLPPGWDDLDAKVIPTDSVNVACCLAALGFHNGYGFPEVSPSPDGEIDLVWPRGSDSLEATVEPDGLVVWVTRERGVVRPGGALDFRAGNEVPLDQARDVIAGWYSGRRAA